MLFLVGSEKNDMESHILMTFCKIQLRKVLIGGPIAAARPPEDLG